MASQIIVSLVDDVDGQLADETVPLALDGTAYEIDLSKHNADSLRDALAPWIAAARRIGRRPRRTVVPVRVITPVDSKAVRAWASSNGIPLAPKGRIPGSVVERFRAAGN